MPFLPSVGGHRAVLHVGSCWVVDSHDQCRCQCVCIGLFVGRVLSLPSRTNLKVRVIPGLCLSVKAGAFLGTACEAVHPLPPTLVTMSFLVPPVEHKIVSASRFAFHFPSGKQGSLPPCSGCLVPCCLCVFKGILLRSLACLFNCFPKLL